MKFDDFEIEQLLNKNGIKIKNLDYFYDEDFDDYRDYICHSLEAIGVDANGEIDIDKVNKITKILLDTNNEVMKRVAWNSFWYCDNNEKWILFKEIDEIACRQDCLLPTNASPEFESERLIIRPNNRDDAEFLSSYIANNDEENSIFYLSVSRYMSKKLILFSVIDKKTNKVIGNIGLYPSYNQTEINTYELQYYIIKEERRKGYSKEAMTALLKQIKEDKIIRQSDYNYINKYEQKHIKIEFLKISCNPSNEASKKLATSLGFKYVGDYELYREIGNDHLISKECIYTKLL